MKRKSNKQTFYVTTDLKIMASYPIEAETLEEALEKSKLLVITDFCEVHGDIYDYDIEISGVHK